MTIAIFEFYLTKPILLNLYILYYFFSQIQFFIINMQSSHTQSSNKKKPKQQKHKQIKQQKSSQFNKYQQCYDPFISDVISTSQEKQGESHRILFQEGEDIINSINNSFTNFYQQQNQEKSYGKYQKVMRKKQILKQKTQQNKENEIDPQQVQVIWGFNNHKKVRYPQTPKFKLFLQSPVSKLLKMFNNKIDYLKKGVERSKNFHNYDYLKNPLQYPGAKYKFFISIAQKFKKEKKEYLVQYRALYKISLYLQPYDENIWQLAIKFQQQLGQYEKAYTLCKAGFLFTQSQILGQKLVKLAQKCDRPPIELRGIICFLNDLKKQQRTQKIYYELAKLEQKYGNIQIAYKVLYYLMFSNTMNGNYILEYAKFLQCHSLIQECFILLESVIQSNVGNQKINLIYTVYIKLISSYCKGQEFESRMLFVINSIQQNSKQINLNNQNTKWKLYLEIFYAYQRMSKQKAKKYLKLAFQLAPQSSKWKPYLIIHNFIGQKILRRENSQVIMQINKYNFKQRKPPITDFIYPDWKYYLHYSIFYIFQNNEEAKKILEQAYQKNSVGRLSAQILWIKRVKSDNSIEKWSQLIQQIPKSGQLWCEGGRIYKQLKQYQKAQLCFKAAIQLTPQYGDSFLQLYALLLLLDRYEEAKNIKFKILYAEPFYGNLWNFLKKHPKSSIIDIWKQAKKSIKNNLYKNQDAKELSCINEYNEYFTKGRELNLEERQKIFSIYQQGDFNK